MVYIDWGRPKKKRIFLKIIKQKNGIFCIKNKQLFLLVCFQDILCEKVICVLFLFLFAIFSMHGAGIRALVAGKTLERANQSSQDVKWDKIVSVFVNCFPLRDDFAWGALPLPQLLSYAMVLAYIYHYSLALYIKNFMVCLHC